jgi:hypothetical protein
MLDYNTIDLDKIEYKKPRKNKSKYLGKVLYNSQEIIINTPYLKCMNPITISENRCYIELELDMDDRELYEFFADLDDININIAYKNSESWFGEQFPLDIIDDYYKPFIRYNNKLRKPYIKLKIPYDKEKGVLLKKFNINDFKKGVYISASIYHDGIKFFKQQFSPEWTLRDFKIDLHYEFKENTESDDLLENEIVNNEINNNEFNNKINNEIVNNKINNEFVNNENNNNENQF